MIVVESVGSIMLLCVQHGEEETGEISEMEIRCWNNVAAAQLKVYS